MIETRQPAFTDWRGQPVHIGDTVVYPSGSGRSSQMTEGVLIDVWRVIRDERWNYKRIEPDEEPPIKLVWEVVRDDDGNPVEEDGVYLRHQVQVPDFEWRARIQPTGDSRWRGHGDWRETGDAHTDYAEKKTVKAVTLTVIQNITLVAPRADR